VGGKGHYGRNKSDSPSTRIVSCLSVFGNQKAELAYKHPRWVGLILARGVGSCEKIPKGRQSLARRSVSSLPLGKRGERGESKGMDIALRRV